MFNIIWSVNVDMAITSPSKSGDMANQGTYKDGTYFELNQDERSMMNEKVEEVCLATRFLSFSNNKLYSQSK